MKRPTITKEQVVERMSPAEEDAAANALQLQTTDLRFRQAAGLRVEQALKKMLFEFSATQSLKVSEVLFIAESARYIAFDAFSNAAHNE